MLGLVMKGSALVADKAIVLFPPTKFALSGKVKLFTENTCTVPVGSTLPTTKSDVWGDNWEASCPNLMPVLLLLTTRCSQAFLPLWCLLPTLHTDPPRQDNGPVGPRVVASLRDKRVD